MCPTDLGDNNCCIPGVLKGYKHGMMLEQELLHIIYLQKMNCLISFTREIEKDINQETELGNFQGSFYYLNIQQS